VNSQPHAPVALPPPTEQEMLGPQKQSGCYGEDKKSLSPTRGSAVYVCASDTGTGVVPRYIGGNGTAQVPIYEGTHIQLSPARG
jgi:hypothetical protein